MKCVIIILGKITEANILPIHTYGRPKISNKKAFMMILWYLSNRESFRQISDRFDDMQLIKLLGVLSNI